MKIIAYLRALFLTCLFLFSFTAQADSNYEPCLSPEQLEEGLSKYDPSSRFRLRLALRKFYKSTNANLIQTSDKEDTKRAQLLCEQISTNQATLHISLFGISGIRSLDDDVLPLIERVYTEISDSRASQNPVTFSHILYGATSCTEATSHHDYCTYIVQVYNRQGETIFTYGATLFTRNKSYHILTVVSDETDKGIPIIARQNARPFPHTTAISSAIIAKIFADQRSEASNSPQKLHPPNKDRKSRLSFK